jgi:IS1 family transposase
MRGYPQWRWHLDEVFVKINGKLCYLWRAVNHEGEVLEAVVTARRDKAAALKLLKRVMKKYGRPRIIVADRLRAYSAAMNEIGIADRHEVGHRKRSRREHWCRTSLHRRRTRRRPRRTRPDLPHSSWRRGDSHLPPRAGKGNLRLKAQQCDKAEGGRDGGARIHVGVREDFSLDRFG